MQSIQLPLGLRKTVSPTKQIDQPVIVTYDVQNKAKNLIDRKTLKKGKSYYYHLIVKLEFNVQRISKNKEGQIDLRLFPKNTSDNMFTMLSQKRMIPELYYELPDNLLNKSDVAIMQVSGYIRSIHQDEPLDLYLAIKSANSKGYIIPKIVLNSLIERKQVENLSSNQ